MIVYGRHPVMEMIEADKDIEKILILKNIERDFLNTIQKLCKERGIPIQHVPKEKLNRTTSENHQGIIATVPMIQYQQIEDVISYVLEMERVPLFVILDNVTDVRNFGSIARSAECLGVDAIIVPEQGSAPVNEISMKTSAGALSRLSICRSKKLSETIAYLQNNGVMVYASSLNSKRQLQEMDFIEPTAIILGSEDHGVQKYIMKSADDTFIIPQSGRTDSLNVSVANGVILYEVQRQRLLNN